MNSDKLTTIIGAAGAAVTAAEPVINGIQGSLHGPDYLKLTMAVLFAVLGFFTNRKQVQSQG